MKKKLLIILLAIITIPNLKAFTFNETKDITNDYIKSSDYQRYLINAAKVPFKYDGNISYDTNFVTGGLINKKEIEISVIDDSSYLMCSIPYWTMTIENNKNILSNFKESTDSNIKVTEYIIKNTYITGRGTYKDPWIFVPKYKVEVTSNDTSKGTITNSIQYGRGNMYFGINIVSGHKYVSNTCSGTIENNKLVIRNVNKDIKCQVNFDNIRYTLTYNNNTGSGCTTKALVHGQKYGDLCTPVKNGYKFMGWYDKTTGGNLITEDTIATGNKTIYARWQLDVVTADNLTVCCGTSCNTSNGKILNYTGECEIISPDNVQTTTTKNWRIRFKSSGTITLATSIKIDLFLVGGGGASGNSWGGGGGGGYTKTVNNVQLAAGTAYYVTVGEGGNISNGCNGTRDPYATACYGGIAHRGETSKITGGSISYEAGGGYGGACTSGAYFGSGQGTCIRNVEDAVSGGSGGSGGGYGYTNMYGDSSCSTGGKKGNNGGGGARGQGFSTCEFAAESDAAGTCPSGIVYSAGGCGAFYERNGGSASANTGGGGSAGAWGEGGNGGSGIVVIRDVR